MGSRRNGRVLAMQALFAWEVTKVPVPEICEFAWLDDSQIDRYDEPTRDFSRLLVAGVLSRIDEVDATIKSKLEHWNFDRLSRVDLAVLRLSAYSLLFQPEIPATVTIDEAIEIVKEFSGDDSYRFVNGILDGIRKQAVRTNE